MIVMYKYELNIRGKSIHVHMFKNLIYLKKLYYDKGMNKSQSQLVTKWSKNRIHINTCDFYSYSLKDEEYPIRNTNTTNVENILNLFM